MKLFISGDMVKSILLRVTYAFIERFLFLHAFKSFCFVRKILNLFKNNFSKQFYLVIQQVRYHIALGKVIQQYTTTLLSLQ